MLGKEEGEGNKQIFLVSKFLINCCIFWSTTSTFQDNSHTDTQNYAAGEVKGRRDKRHSMQINLYCKFFFLDRTTVLNEKCITEKLPWGSWLRADKRQPRSDSFQSNSPSLTATLEWLRWWKCLSNQLETTGHYSESWSKLHFSNRSR